LRTSLLIAVMVLLSTCSRSPTLLDQVRAEGELRVVTRNSPITYYIGPAGPEGPEYDLVRGFAEHLGVRLRLVEADRFSDLLAQVESGQVHMAAAGLTVTAERASRVAFGPVYQQVAQHVVYRRGRPTPHKLEDLRGRRIEVVAQSSYVEALEESRRQVTDLAWSEDPTADAGEILNRVARGEVDVTVVDSNLFSIFQRFHPELKIGFDLTSGDALAWAFPRNRDRSLIAAAEAYLEQLRTSGDLGHIMDRYYGHKVKFDYASTRRFIQDYRNRFPRYRQVFIRAAERSGIDWRLLAAVGYQESKWDPTAVSPKGAQGIMMLTGDTAQLIGVADPMDASQSIQGGAKYLWRMLRRVERLSPEIPEKDALWMALAAYNMGYGHLLDARRLTAMQGGNPDRWVDLRTHLPLLMERRHYSKLRWGYARSAETVAYVRNIRNYYDILVWLTEQEEQDRVSPPAKQLTAGRDAAGKAAAAPAQVASSR
jgi:membrane-bound lytic murein transglycosylase F